MNYCEIDNEMQEASGRNALIGAHNAFTYLKASQWWLRPLWIFWRCQSRGIEHQARNGARLFDVRLRFRKGGTCVSHGCVRFDLSAGEAMELLLRHVESPTVRLLLEGGSEEDKKHFRTLCADMERRYPDVRFIGGNYKPTWERLYAFGRDNICNAIDQQVGSMKSIYGKALPWLWHRLNGKEALERARKSAAGVYLFDFL